MTDATAQNEIQLESLADSVETFAMECGIRRDLGKYWSCFDKKGVSRLSREPYKSAL